MNNFSFFCVFSGYIILVSLEVCQTPFLDTYQFLLCFCNCSIACLTVKMLSCMLLPFLNPDCVSSNSGSMFVLHRLFLILLYYTQKCYSSVISTFHSASFFLSMPVVALSSVILFFQHLRRYFAISCGFSFLNFLIDCCISLISTSGFSVSF